MTPEEAIGGDEKAQTIQAWDDYFKSGGYKPSTKDLSGEVYDENIDYTKILEREELARAEIAAEKAGRPFTPASAKTAVETGLPKDPPKFKGNSFGKVAFDYISARPKVVAGALAGVGALVVARQMLVGLHTPAQWNGINRSNKDMPSDFNSRRNLFNSASSSIASVFSKTGIKDWSTGYQIAAVALGVGVGAFGAHQAVHGIRDFLFPTTFEWGRASQFGLEAQNMRGAVSEDYDTGMDSSGKQITGKGDIIHEQVQQALMAQNPNIIAEYAIRDPEVKLTGHVDLIIPTQVGEGQVAYIPTEIKTIADDKLSRLKGVKEGQRAQAQFYLHYLSKTAERQGTVAPDYERFIYVSRENPTRYKEFFLERNEEEFQFYLKRYRGYQKEMKEKGAAPKDATSTVKVMSEIAQQEYTIRRNIIRNPDAVALTPEETSRSIEQAIIKLYGIPQGLRSERTAESSYGGFEAMKPHPGTDFPGGRDFFNKASMEVAGILAKWSHGLTDRLSAISTPRQDIGTYDDYFRQIVGGVNDLTGARITGGVNTSKQVIGVAEFSPGPKDMFGRVRSGELVLNAHEYGNKYGEDLIDLLKSPLDDVGSNRFFKFQSTLLHEAGHIDFASRFFHDKRMDYAQRKLNHRELNLIKDTEGIYTSIGSSRARQQAMEEPVVEASSIVLGYKDYQGKIKSKVAYSMDTKELMETLGYDNFLKEYMQKNSKTIKHTSLDNTVHDIESPVKSIWKKPSLKMAQNGPAKFKTINKPTPVKIKKLNTMNRAATKGAKYGPTMQRKAMRLNPQETSFSRLNGGVMV